MDNITRWTKVICLVSIISGVILSIIPKSKIKSAYKLLVISILLYCIISPFSDFNFNEYDFSYLFGKNEEIQSEYEMKNSQMIIDTSESAIEDFIKQQLDSKNIAYTSIIVTCKYENEQISIEDVSILGNFTQEQQTIITDLIQSNLQVVDILNMNGDENE